MNGKLNRLMKDERGITALETAIILIAFVVVAAIFAFTVLSTGTFLTERSKEAAYAGLQEVRGSMEMKGSVVLSKTTAAGDTVVFNLATVAGGSSVDLSKVKMTYRDSAVNTDLTYDPAATPGDNSWTALDMNDLSKTMSILTVSNLAKITVSLPVTQTANHLFALEVKPPTGGVLQIERTCPAQIDDVTDLH